MREAPTNGAFSTLTRWVETGGERGDKTFSTTTPYRVGGGGGGGSLRGGGGELTELAPRSRRVGQSGLAAIVAWASSGMNIRPVRPVLMAARPTPEHVDLLKVIGAGLVNPTDHLLIVAVHIPDFGGALRHAAVSPTAAALAVTAPQSGIRRLPIPAPRGWGWVQSRRAFVGTADAKLDARRRRFSKKCASCFARISDTPAKLAKSLMVQWMGRTSHPRFFLDQEIISGWGDIRP